jgi:hypothetical protein
MTGQRENRESAAAPSSEANWPTPSPRAFPLAFLPTHKQLPLRGGRCRDPMSSAGVVRHQRCTSRRIRPEWPVTPRRQHFVLLVRAWRPESTSSSAASRSCIHPCLSPSTSKPPKRKAALLLQTMPLADDSDGTSRPALPNNEPSSEQSAADGVDEAPDGGERAWLVVLGAWCSLLCTAGWVNSKPPLPLPHKGHFKPKKVLTKAVPRHWRLPRTLPDRIAEGP